MSNETPHPRPTKQDFDAVSPETAKMRRYVEAAELILKPLVRLLFRIPPIGRALDRTVGGRMGAIARCKERGDHGRAVDLAFETLQSEEYRHGPHFGRIGPAPPAFWWTFLVAALHSLEQLDDPAKWEEALELARDRDEPPQGYEIAQCYAAFARWKGRMGDHEAALDLAETARRADGTWAEPELLVGWLRLALGGGDPLPHLTAAVRRDPGTLSRITKDPLFRQRPDIIARLKEIAKQAAEGVD